MVDFSIQQISELEARSNKHFHLDRNKDCYIHDLAQFEKSANFYELLLLPAKGRPINCSSSFISILFCYGPAVVSVGEQKTSCFAGNIILFHSKCDFVVQPKEGSVIYLALYKKEMIDNLFMTQIADCLLIYCFFSLKNSTNEYLYFDSSLEMPIQQFAKALLLELANFDCLSIKAVRCSTVLFMTNLQRIHRTHLVINESSMMRENLIGDILKYLADNYKTATLANTAAHFNYHPAYFSAMFHKKALCSFTTKLRELRLEQARRLLVSTDLSVQDIIDTVGFKDKGHFYRWFKTTYGLTPLAYRAKYADEIIMLSADANPQNPVFSQDITNSKIDNSIFDDRVNYR